MEEKFIILRNIENGVPYIQIKQKYAILIGAISISKAKEELRIEVETDKKIGHLQYSYVKGSLVPYRVL